MQPPRTWSFLDDAPFQDIYDNLDLRCQPRRFWRTGELKQRIVMPLRLAPGGSVTGAEMWILRERAIAQLDELVAGATDQLISRLSFAVTEPMEGSEPIIVLRVRPSKVAPPALVLDATEFAPTAACPTCFCPAVAGCGLAFASMPSANSSPTIRPSSTGSIPSTMADSCPKRFPTRPFSLWNDGSITSSIVITNPCRPGSRPLALISNRSSARTISRCVPGRRRTRRRLRPAAPKTTSRSTSSRSSISTSK